MIFLKQNKKYKNKCLKKFNLKKHKIKYKFLIKINNSKKNKNRK